MFPTRCGFYPRISAGMNFFDIPISNWCECASRGSYGWSPLDWAATGCGQ